MELTRQHFGWIAVIVPAISVVAAWALGEPLWYPSLALLGVILFGRFLRMLEHKGWRAAVVLGLPVTFMILGFVAGISAFFVFITFQGFLIGMLNVMRANPDVVRQWRGDDLIR